MECTSDSLHFTTLVYRLTRTGMLDQHLGIAAAALSDEQMVVHRNARRIDHDVVARFAKNPADDDTFWSVWFGANDEISVVRGR
jgi:hypothetical protein